jgi:hypothetical protein
MKTPSQRATIAIGLFAGAIVWIAMPFFLPMLMWGEASSGKDIPAALFVLTGPAVYLPLSILGINRPSLASRLFYCFALLNIIFAVVWALPSSSVGEHGPWNRHPWSELLGVFVFLILPGPVLLSVFGIQFSRMPNRISNS